MTDKQEPEYWQWRRKSERWGIDQIYRHEVYATTDDSEVRQLFAAPPAQPDHQGHSCTHKCTWPQCEATKQEQHPQRLPLVQATAPREIWLEISDEQDDNGEPFPDDTEGITWCQDSALTCEVKYVRADLAAQPAHPDEFACPLCFDDPANIKPAEPVQLTETEIFKAYTTATGKVLPNKWGVREELVAITRIVERAHGIEAAPKATK